eukprot:3787867-Alexandrium_andersonii.AAC.1
MAMTCCLTRPRGESCMRTPPTAEISAALCTRGAPHIRRAAARAQASPGCLPPPQGGRMERNCCAWGAQDRHSR